VVYSNVWCEELSQTKMSDNTFAASQEGWALERWEGQQRAECRKTCGRGAKQTQIMGMGYSTRRRDLWLWRESINGAQSALGHFS